MKENKGFNLISVITIICITSVVSALTAGVIISNNYGLSYWALAGDKELNEFLKAYSNIVDNYYEDIDKGKMLDSALDAMLEYLGDDYTTLLTEKQKKDLDEKLSGYYDGIGVKISDHKIVKVFKNSPAEKAGLKVDDIITSVSGTDVSNVDHNGITALIKIQKEKVVLGILRGEMRFEATVAIEKIPSSVDYEMKENNIGYMRIDIFSKPLTTQVSEALKDLEEQGMQKLIIDLRDNTGGYLESAESTASIFLEKGKPIYSLEDNKKKETYYDETDEKREYPIVVIMNNNSASASEILAAALKDSYGAKLVGETSYGKGRVQQTFELSNGGVTKYTSARWLRPNGSCIDGVGLKPDYESFLEYEKDENGNEILKIDTQLNKALEVIGTM